MNVKIEFDSRAVERACLDAARRAVAAGVDVECPHRGRAIRVHGGENRCPGCGSSVVVDVRL